MKMTRSEVASMGGKLRAIQQRQAAKNRYEAAPNFCKCCGAKIELRDNQNVGETRTKKFCNRSCAGRFNRNRGGTGKVVERTCAYCETPFTARRLPNSSLSTAKHCDTCLENELAGIRGHPKLTDRTKQEIFESAQNWQSARSQIRGHAARVFAASNPSPACFCGYAAYVEACHRIPVSDFPPTATIGEINHPNNLVGLCPNHHWELDHGLLKLVAGVGVSPTEPSL